MMMSDDDGKIKISFDTPYEELERQEPDTWFLLTREIHHLHSIFHMRKQVDENGQPYGLFAEYGTDEQLLKRMQLLQSMLEGLSTEGED